MHSVPRDQSAGMLMKFNVNEVSQAPNIKRFLDRLIRVGLLNN